MQIKDRIFGSGILSDEGMKKELHLFDESNEKTILQLMKYYLLRFCKILKDERVLQSVRVY